MSLGIATHIPGEGSILLTNSVTRKGEIMTEPALDPKNKRSPQLKAQRQGLRVFRLPNVRPRRDQSVNHIKQAHRATDKIHARISPRGSRRYAVQAIGCRGVAEARS